MKNFLIPIVTLLLINSLVGQSTIEKTLEKHNNKSIPYISAEELVSTKNILIFDARKKEEFNVSHLNNAIWVGYEKFEIDSLPIKNKNIVVYCSIRVRSEDIGEKLIAGGYKYVQNLYGGIFSWVEKGYPVYDNSNRQTNRIHVFSKYWGKLLTKGEKVLH